MICVMFALLCELFWPMLFFVDLPTLKNTNMRKHLNFMFFLGFVFLGCFLRQVLGFFLGFILLFWWLLCLALLF